MNKQFLAISLISLLFLASCGGQSTDTNTESGVTTEKTDFIVRTDSLGSFGTDISTEKTAVIQADSTLTLGAEANGQISKILVKEGQTVRAGAPIATISDTMSNFDLLLSQARNNIELQKAGNASQMANLDISISNAETAYKKALQSYNQLLEKTNLQYDNLVDSNNTTLKTYNDSYRSQMSGLDATMTQLLHDADEILGMTKYRQYENDAWQGYLGLLNGEGSGKSEDSWNMVTASRGAIRARLEKKTDFTESPNEDIAILEKGMENTRKMVDNMISMLQNSVENRYLTREMLQMWLQKWNAHRSAIQGTESQFVSWKTQTNAFLDNYKQKEIATKLATQKNTGMSAEEFNALQKDEKLKLAYQNADLGVREAIDNAKLSVSQAKDAWENAKKIKATTERQLVASLNNAQIGLAQAERNAGKLTVTAPIAGTITKISAEVGQSVSIGTPVAEFAGSQAQAAIEVDPRVALFLKVGDKVKAVANDQEITGTIASVSTIAGKNLLSSVRIVFPKADKLIGQPVVVKFQISDAVHKNSFLLPINAVRIIAEGQGKIETLVDGKIVTHNVQLGAMYGGNVEVFTDLPADTQVVLSDVTQYNSETQKLVTEKFAH